MVESFLGQDKDNNLIEEEKIMEDFLNNDGNGSSIFQGKIREEDFSAEQKLNELKAAIEELDRQDLLRRLECERQALVVSMKYHLKQSYISEKEIMRITSMVKEKEYSEISGISLNLSSTSLK
ncbi:hypothetical protein MWH06_00095 [Wolbachia pipientis]|nr:hypothetical protein MWH06_00095 [Wolbachia pipientis]